MKIIIIIKLILCTINFVNIIIIEFENQNWYQKLNVSYFWNNYITCIIIINPKNAQIKRGRYNVLSPKISSYNFYLGID
jgi:hypothetical protein